MMAYRYSKFSALESWWQNGLLYGFMVGISVFWAGHMTVAGWSTIPAVPMFISGLLDTLCVTAGGLGIAWIHQSVAVEIPKLKIVD